MADAVSVHHSSHQRARARAMERSKDLCSQCMDFHAPSRTLLSKSVACLAHGALLQLTSVFHRGWPYDGHAAYMRLWGKPWRVELPGFTEVVDYRKRTRPTLENQWARGVFVGIKVGTTERSSLTARAHISRSRSTECQRSSVATPSPCRVSEGCLWS